MRLHFKSSLSDLWFCDDFVTTVATVPVKDFLTSVVYNSHESDHIRLNLCRGSFMSCRVKKKRVSGSGIRQSVKLSKKYCINLNVLDGYLYCRTYIPWRFILKGSLSNKRGCWIECKKV